ncbi:MAG: signal peptide protein [Rhodocyclaceae bacterium]|nr:MAG: signal peptide protein [Rhodocyclaceae bacterium]TND03721.1 MAG: signal peptide protein [Rhodocyclaceae bacterium]
MKTTKYLPAVAAVVGALVSPASFADNADIRFRIGDGSFAIAIGAPPPVRVVAYVPVAMPGHVWVPGYWAWNGHRQIWNSGAWERPRQHYRQAAGHWEQRNEPRRFESPRWESRQAVERHSQTRDYGRQVRYEDRRDLAFFRGRDARREHSR